MGFLLGEFSSERIVRFVTLDVVMLASFCKLQMSRIHELVLIAM
jgi:hypothetical protein